MQIASETEARMAGMRLELKPLLAPYRGRGQLSLRIERLPPRARFSHGNNNGDRTWSLTPDDLDGLLYLPPEGSAAHSLGLRIISLDGDYGATLAVLDVPVAPGTSPSSAVCETPAPASAPKGGAERDSAALKDALAEARSLLAEREAALAQSQQELEQARATQARHEQRLADAQAEAASVLARSRTDWQAEAERRDAEREAALPQLQQELEQARAAQARLEQRLADAQAEAASAPARSRADWQAKAERRDAEREAALAQLQQELEQARAAQARHEQRLADAQAEAASALAQSRADWQQEAERRDAEREAGAAARIEAAQRAAAQDGEAALANASEALRRAVNEAEARQQAQKALAEAKARLARSEASFAATRSEADAARIAQDRLRTELAAATASLARTESELTQLRGQLDSAQAEQLGLHAELAAAQGTFKAEIEAKLAEAATQAAALLEKSRTAFREEQEAERAVLARRAEEATEAARARGNTELQAALSAAESAWTAREESRVAEAVARARNESTSGLTETIAQLERAEAALAETRTRTEGDAVELHFLREELAEVKAALTARETELVELGSAAGSAPKLGQLQLADRLLSGRGRALEEAQKSQAADVPPPAAAGRDRPRRGRGILGLAAVAAVAAMAAIAYVTIEPGSFDDLWPGGAPAVGESLASPPVASGDAESAMSAKVATRVVIAIEHANLRAGPSPQATVFAVLPRDATVTPVERRGAWVLVRLHEEGAPTREGWVYGSSLKLTTGR